MTGKCVVMVTGGSGFLGQHVIKLLNTHADHVTSIRVVDLVPFENKLDYSPTKPIHHYVGSITDENLMREAMRGCHCVIHLAAIVDYSMFPNKEKLEHVNVQGTVVTLRTAQESSSVRRFIGCGTVAVLSGPGDNILDGTEDTPILTQWCFHDYVSSKYTGERIVLEANCPEFSTVVLRPVNMYGELDDTTVTSCLHLAAKYGGYDIPVGNGQAIHQMAYVGNVAWAFVCAEKKLFEEQNVAFQQKPRNCSLKQAAVARFSLKSSEKLMNRSLEQNESLTSKVIQIDDRNKVAQDQSIGLGGKGHTISGQAFFVSDDTPVKNMFQLRRVFVEGCGYRTAKLKIPYYLIVVFFYITYAVLCLLSLVGIKLNVEYGLQAMQYLTTSLTVKYQKAEKEIGYKPLYTAEESKDKSLIFYKDIVKKLTSK